MEAHENSEASQISGNSIFWALVALALNAMAEPSRLSGLAANSEPSFDPLRSSPVLCAADIFLDIFFSFVKPKPQGAIPSANPSSDTPNTTEHRRLAGGENSDALPGPALAISHPPAPDANSTASSRSTLKAASFLLGALPQAIKLFSMRGIPGTQICAAMFLAAPVTRAISCKSSSEFAASIDILNSYNIYTVRRVLFVLYAFIALAGWLYFNIASAAVSNPSADVLFTLALLARVLYTPFALLIPLLSLAWRRSVPFTKLIPMIACWWTVGLDVSPPRYTESGGMTRRPPDWFKSSSLAFYLLILSLIGSALISVLCTTSGRVLTRLAAKRAASSGGQIADSSLPTMSASTDRPSPTDLITGFAKSLRRWMVWLQAIVVGLFKAIDNHGEWLKDGVLNRYGMSTEQIRLAWGIFHLLSVVLYYLVVFESAGTVSPSWTSALG
jgi:hypothetical protein